MEFLNVRTFKLFSNYYSGMKNCFTRSLFLALASQISGFSTFIIRDDFWLLIGQSKTFQHITLALYYSPFSARLSFDMFSKQKHYNYADWSMNRWPSCSLTNIRCINLHFSCLRVEVNDWSAGAAISILCYLILSTSLLFNGKCNTTITLSILRGIFCCTLT